MIPVRGSDGASLRRNKRGRGPKGRPSITCACPPKSVKVRTYRGSVLSKNRSPVFGIDGYAYLRACPPRPIGAVSKQTGLPSVPRKRAVSPVRGPRVFSRARRLTRGWTYCSLAEETRRPVSDLILVTRTCLMVLGSWYRSLCYFSVPWLWLWLLPRLGAVALSPSFYSHSFLRAHCRYL